MVKYKIAISGKAKSGKNTVANIIINILKEKGYKRSKILAFADPIKQIVRIMFPFLRKNYLFGKSEFRSKQIKNAKNKDGDPLTIRQALIDIGTGLGRAYNERIWLDVFDYKFNQIKNHYDVIMCSDLRFYNEWEYLKENNYFIVKINRNDALQINHISETSVDTIPLDGFDIILDNNKDIEYLEAQIRENLIPLLNK